MLLVSPGTFLTAFYQLVSQKTFLAVFVSKRLRIIVKFSPLKTPPPLPWSEIQILTKDSFFGGRPLVSFLLAD